MGVEFALGRGWICHDIRGCDASAGEGARVRISTNIGGDCVNVGEGMIMDR